MQTNKVSEQALIKRINRKLVHEGSWGQRLRKYRGGRWWADLGDFYLIDIDTNGILATHVDLEQQGREIGALAKYETLAD